VKKTTEVGWLISFLLMVPFAETYTFFCKVFRWNGQLAEYNIYINWSFIVVQNTLLYYLWRWEKKQVSSEEIALAVKQTIGRVLRFISRKMYFAQIIVAASSKLHFKMVLVRTQDIFSFIKNVIVCLAANIGARTNLILDKLHFRKPFYFLRDNIFIAFTASLYFRAAVSLVALKDKPVNYLPGLVLGMYAKAYVAYYTGWFLATALESLL